MLKSVSDELGAGTSASQPPTKRPKPAIISRHASEEVRNISTAATLSPYISGSHVVPSVARMVRSVTSRASSDIKMTSGSKRNAQSPAPGDANTNKGSKRNKPDLDEGGTEVDEAPEHVPKERGSCKPAPSKPAVPTVTSTRPPRMTANTLSTAPPAPIASASTTSKTDPRYVRDAEGCTQLPVPGRPLKDQKAKPPAGATESEIESDLAEMRKGMPRYSKAGWKAIERDIEERADQTQSGRPISPFGPGMSAERFTLTEEWESQREKLPRRRRNDPIANAELAPRAAKLRVAEASEGLGTPPSRRSKRTNPYPARLAANPEALEARRKQVLEQGRLTPTGIRNRLRRVDEDLEALRAEREELRRQQSADPKTFQQLREEVSTFVGPLTFGKRTSAGIEEMLLKVGSRLSVLQNQQEQLQGHRNALRRDKAQLEREEQAPFPLPDPVQSVMEIGAEGLPWPLSEGTYWSDRDKLEGGLRVIPGYEERLTSAQQNKETMSEEKKVEDDLVKDLGDEEFDLPKVWGDYQWEQRQR